MSKRGKIKTILIAAVIVLVLVFLVVKIFFPSDQCICGSFSSYKPLEGEFPAECNLEFKTLQEPIKSKKIWEFWNADCCHQKPKHDLVERAVNFESACALAIFGQEGIYLDAEDIFRDNKGNYYYYYGGNI